MAIIHVSCDFSSPNIYIYIYIDIDLEFKI